MEREIFDAARLIQDAAARRAYLETACAGDDVLRRQVEALLNALEGAVGFLERPVVPEIAAADGPGTLPDPPGRLRKIAHGDLPQTEWSDSSGMRVPHVDEEEDETPLDFLEPSDTPGSLGRLGHYVILEVLGKGGFGIVFRALDETLQRMVAIKVLSAQIAATSPARKRFLREARSSAKVRHESIVQVYAVEEQPLPYLVMEFIPGETLQERLDRTGPLETADVLQFGRQIAEGLAAAHGTGLIHRDIKPGNILIEAGPSPHVKITDFGLARAADDAGMTQSGIIAGTPMFMAPEQARGEALDHRADLFSFGSVLYTMCSGRPPFRAPAMMAVLKRVIEDTPRPIRESIPEVPEWLCDLIARLQAKKPEDRPTSAQEVADLLAKGLEDLQSEGKRGALPLAARPAPEAAEPTVPRIPDPGETVALPPRGRPRFAGRRHRVVAASLLLALLGGLGLAEASGVSNVRGVVVRLFFPDGTLIVEVGDPKVSVRIDGSDLVITGTGVKELRVKPGDYRVVASRDGRVVQQELVRVERNGQRIFRVTRETVSAAISDKGLEPLNRKPTAEALAAPAPQEIINSLGMKLVLIPAGEFLMGSPHSDRDAKLNEKPQHQVRISRPFYLGATEVTQGRYRAVNGANPLSYEASDDLPVEEVSWFDAVNYCDALSRKEGLPEFYRIKDLRVEVPDWTGPGYRLPTEAEWEYACRGGSTTRYGHGDNAERLGEYAWCVYNSRNESHPVGGKRPNGFGLYDMHGNVWEWCWDFFDGMYYWQSPATDPLGPLQAAFRVYRGGARQRDSGDCRSANREKREPTYRTLSLGFRVARGLSDR